MKFPNKKNINQEEGVALLLTVIIISAVMMIASMIANIVITQMQLVEDIGSSVSAIYAADSGVECQLYNIRHGGQSLSCKSTDIPGGNIMMFNGATVETTRSDNPPSYTIESRGSYRSVKRKFQVNIGS